MTPVKKQPSLPRDLPKARLDELKTRVESDYYDSPPVLDAVADRLLHSGDLVE